MDKQQDSTVARTPSDDTSDDTVETAVVALGAASNDAVAQALRVVYANLPGDVVRRCERHRIGATSDYLRHMREVRDALAPYGEFKRWCAVQGINYPALKTKLGRRFGEVAPDTRTTHSRQLENAAFSAGLPASALHPVVVGEKAHPDDDAVTKAVPEAATKKVTVTVDETVDGAADDAGIDDGGDGTESETESETENDAVDAAHPGYGDVTLDDTARVLAWEFAEFRRSFGVFRAAHHAHPDVSMVDVEAWWEAMDADEWASAVETYRWFMDATQAYRVFMASHYQQQPPMARTLTMPSSMKQDMPRSGSTGVSAIDTVAPDDVVGTMVVEADHDGHTATDDATSDGGVADDADFAMLERAVDAAYAAWQAAAADGSPADFAEVHHLWEAWDALAYRLAVAPNPLTARDANGDTK